MCRVRLAYAADLPTPDDVIRALTGNNSSQGTSAPPTGATGQGGSGPATGAMERTEARSGTPPTAVQPMAVPRATSAFRPVAQSGAQPARMPPAEAESLASPLVIKRFEDLIALAGQKRDIGVKIALERDVRLVRMRDGRRELALESRTTRTLVNHLSQKLSQWTGRGWWVVVPTQASQPTVKA